MSEIPATYEVEGVGSRVQGQLERSETLSQRQYTNEKKGWGTAQAVEALDSISSAEEKKSKL
jgi:hypothetical protein